MSLMEPPKVEKINDPKFNLALRNQNLMADNKGGQVLSNGVTLVVGGGNDGKIDTNVSASVEDSGIGDVDEDFEMTLEEAAALLGEDDLELEDEKMMREHLKHESKKKQKHKSLKKQGRKGRVRTANPYGDEESSRVYGVQIQIAGNTGKGSKRKQKMRAKHAGKRSDL